MSAPAAHVKALVRVRRDVSPELTPDEVAALISEINDAEFAPQSSNREQMERIKRFIAHQVFTCTMLIENQQFGQMTEPFNTRMEKLRQHVLRNADWADMAEEIQRRYLFLLCYEHKFAENTRFEFTLAPNRANACVITPDDLTQNHYVHRDIIMYRVIHEIFSAANHISNMQPESINELLDKCVTPQDSLLVLYCTQPSHIRLSACDSSVFTAMNSAQCVTFNCPVNFDELRLYLHKGTAATRSLPIVISDKCGFTATQIRQIASHIRGINWRVPLTAEVADALGDKRIDVSITTATDDAWCTLIGKCITLKMHGDGHLPSLRRILPGALDITITGPSNALQVFETDDVACCTVMLVGDMPIGILPRLRCTTLIVSCNNVFTPEMLSGLTLAHARTSENHIPYVTTHACAHFPMTSAHTVQVNACVYSNLGAECDPRR
jgi:hypothetical protein